MMAGAWFLGCFFLVQIYSSTLTSHLTSPNQKPIVNSFFEIADSPGVSLTIDKGFALDVLLQVRWCLVFNSLQLINKLISNFDRLISDNNN